MVSYCRFLVVLMAMFCPLGLPCPGRAARGDPLAAGVNPLLLDMVGLWVLCQIYLTPWLFCVSHRPRGGCVVALPDV